jgi:hypothetical protein
MRSVVIHLVNATRDAVRTHLTQFAQPEDGDRWLYPPAASQPSLYIEFYEKYEREVAADELLSLTSALGEGTRLSILANVSGRVPGDVEVQAFAECLLSVFRGVAEDEYSKCFWSLEEIRAGVKQGELKFFDYEGWYKSRSAS